MLALRFQIGELRFALETARILEVLPSMALQPVPHAPGWLGGLFSYRGKIVPVIDMHAHLWGSACPRRFNTRVLLCPVGSGGGTRLIGLIVERATELVEVGEMPRAPSAEPGRLALGAAQVDGSGFFHRLDPSVMLPAEWQAALAAFV